MATSSPTQPSLLKGLLMAIGVGLASYAGLKGFAWAAQFFLDQLPMWGLLRGPVVFFCLLSFLLFIPAATAFFVARYAGAREWVAYLTPTVPAAIVSIHPLRTLLMELADDWDRDRLLSIVLTALLGLAWVYITTQCALKLKRHWERKSPENQSPMQPEASRLQG